MATSITLADTQPSEETASELRDLGAKIVQVRLELPLVFIVGSFKAVLFSSSLRIIVQNGSFVNDLGQRKNPQQMFETVRFVDKRTILVNN